MSSSEERGFKPSERIIRIQGGAEYLQVRDRLIWLRREAPESQVRTEALRVEDGFAFFKATVTKIIDGEVKGVGEGHGSETAQGFPPGFIEKAETIAIGRALAALGYGTAAAFEEDGEGKIADAPTPAPVQQARPPQQQQPRPFPIQAGGGAPPISDKQLNYLLRLGNDLQWSHEYLHEQLGVTSLRDLDKTGASDAIEKLQALTKRQQSPPQAPQPAQDGPEEPQWLLDAPRANATWQ